MSSSEINAVALVTPTPGKESRLRELLVKLGNDVKANELNVRKYQVHEQFNGEGGNIFVVQEIYKDQATYDAHFVTNYFQELGKILADEKLLAKPLNIMTMKPFAGFEHR